MNKKYPYRINLHIKKDLYDFLKDHAEKSDRPLSNYTRGLLERIRQIIETEEKKKI